jgi:hypothetical protein
MRRRSGKNAKEFLRRMRSGEADPFGDDAPHEWARHCLKAIADSDERNAAFVVEMAVREMEDAREALVAPISERNIRGEPIGPALTTSFNMISRSKARKRCRESGRRLFADLSAEEARFEAAT